MKNRWISLALAGALLMLLILSAALQYVWVGQISDAERERLRNKLQSDTQNFAADFNKEIRGAYFTFQIDPQNWLEKDWNEFNDRFRLWQTQTAYPQLIQDFYFVGKDSPPVRYDAEAQIFKPTEWTEELRRIQSKIKETEVKQLFEPGVINEFTLLMPNYSAGRKTFRSEANVSNLEVDLSGYVVIKLNENVVNQIIEDLKKRYFADESTHFNISILNKSDSRFIYPQNQTAAQSPEFSDASISLFDLSVTNFRVITNSKVFSTDNKVRQRQAENMLKNLPPAVMTKKDTVKVHITDNRQNTLESPEAKGFWTLNVRHADGSLEQFTEAARRRNLMISLGLIGILTVGLILIVVSAQRAKMFAQRQVDFVSSVSHEFRTPLAVIHSAGENLADGVAKDEHQVSRYGDLIRDESRKLSKMVEQILDFAGANSGRKKYDWRAANADEIIENALAECQSLLKAGNFEVEREIAANLPPIIADKSAMSQAIQNLIVNSVKYSNGEKYLKISAYNGGGRVKITVEDKGIGIEPNDIKHIFKPFYRSKAVIDEQIHGSGLGLSLVKKTVAAHGGKISVSSEVGVGTRFTIEMKSDSANN